MMNNVLNKNSLIGALIILLLLTSWWGQSESGANKQLIEEKEAAEAQVATAKAEAEAQVAATKTQAEAKATESQQALQDKSVALNNATEQLQKAKEKTQASEKKLSEKTAALATLDQEQKVLLQKINELEGELTQAKKQQKQVGSQKQQEFEKVVAETINPEIMQPELLIDSEITLGQITPKLVRILKQFAPFGPNNRTPVFMARGLIDTGFARTVGAESNHLKMTLTQEGGIPFDTIGFHLGTKLQRIANRQPFDAVFTIEENNWNGQTRIQLRIKDLR